MKTSGQIQKLSSRIAWALAVGLVAAAALGERTENGRALPEIGGIAIPFIANRGQLDRAVAFYAPTSAGTVFVTRKGRIVYSLPAERDKAGSPAEKGPGWTLTESFLGGRVRPVGEDDAGTRISSFVGSDPARWQSDLPTHRTIRIGEVWPGITVSLRAHGHNVEKLFTVSPGASATAIRVKVAGTRALRVDGTGALVAETGLGEVAWSAPVAYQEKDGLRVPVRAAYSVRGKLYGFRLGAYDPDLSVVIDPLLQATYLGGSQNDPIDEMAIHPATGQVYVTGNTTSTNYPGTAGGFQPTTSGFGGRDAFVARLDASLTVLLQATYFGTSAPFEAARGMTIHPATGDVYIVGLTSSSSLPGTAGGSQPVYGGGSFDAFAARFNANLTLLLQSTYLGGTAIDDGCSVVVHPISGDVYVGGRTDSTNFPGTAGSAQPTLASASDGFIARLNADLTSMTRATYLGGDSTDLLLTYLAAHPVSGDIYVSGRTSGFFPGTAGGAQLVRGAGLEAIVARLNADLTQLLQATYLGGNGNDDGRRVMVHPVTGDVYVVGETESSNFPGTAGGAQPIYRSHDGFAARLNASLTTLLQSTYLGGTSLDFAQGIALHPSNGDIYVAGDTNSNNFPGTIGAAQAASAGGADAFVARLNPGLTTLVRATYLGGTSSEQAIPVALHPVSGEVYVAGFTGSSNFPGTAGGAQPAFGGGDASLFGDGFVARLTPDLLGTGVAFYTVTPCRVLDTRNTNGPYGGPTIFATGTRNFTFAGQCGIPPGASAVSLNVTVTEPSAPGHLRIFPAGLNLPPVSAINYSAGQTRANNAIATLGAGGALGVFCGQAAGTVHFIADVNGYFQ